VRDEHSVLWPTIARRSTPSAARTVSDERDNGRRMVDTSKVAATFDVIVPDHDPSPPDRVLRLRRPLAAEGFGDGLLRAPRLGADAVFRRYGKSAFSCPTP
jgi:hypothetical protein